MAEEATTTVTTEETGNETETTVEDQTVPYDRFKKANTQAKEAKDRAKAKLEREMADLKAQMEEASTAGLPELERIKARREGRQARRGGREARAGRETKAQNTQRERWVAAAAKDFVDPDDAARFVDLSDIESAEDAERAVKRVAKTKPHLLKGDEPKLPGRVLENGRTATKKKDGGIDLDAEAQMISDELAKFLKTAAPRSKPHRCRRA
jgi:hypothetical protein